MANEIVVELITRMEKAEAQIDRFRKKTEKDLGFLRLSATNFVGAFTATAAFDAFKSGVSAMAGFMKDSVGAAAESQAAINALNVALAQNGNFSKQASENLQNFANEIQKKTKFADDAVVKNLALLESLTQLDAKGLKRAQGAAVDLASALQIDLNTATEMVAKAANGNVTSFQRMGIEIEKGSSDTQTFANALKTLEERFKGVAEAEAKTFAGATAQLSNQFDELQEQLGSVITNNPAVVEGMKFISDAFIKLGEFVKKNKEMLKEWVAGGIQLLIQSIPFAVDGVMLLIEGWNGLNFVFQALKHLIGGIAEGLGRLAEFAGLSAESLIAWGEETQRVALETANTDIEATQARLEALQQFRDELQISADERVANIDRINFAEEDSTNKSLEQSNKRVQIKRDEVKKLTDEDKKRMGLAQQMELHFAETYKQAQINKVGAFKDSLGQIATLQQSESHRLFRIGQGAAIAQAIINTAEGITKAWAIGGPFGAPLAALVAAAGAAQIGVIGSQKPPSSAKDGIDFIPEDRMTWIASRGERVVGARLNEDLSRFLDEQRQGFQSQGPNNNVTINVSGVIGEFDDSSRTQLASELIAALEFQNVSRRGVI